MLAMKQTDRPEPAPTAAQPKPRDMSVRTFFRLNGGFLLVLVFAALYVYANDNDSEAFWGFILGTGLVSVLAVVANGFLFFKALWRREYLLALGYLVVVVGAVMVITALPAPRKIGG